IAIVIGVRRCRGRGGGVHIGIRIGVVRGGGRSCVVSTIGVVRGVGLCTVCAIGVSGSVGRSLRGGVRGRGSRCCCSRTGTSSCRAIGAGLIVVAGVAGGVRG